MDNTAFVFLWGIRHSLPFTWIGVAIISGVIECFALLLVSARFMVIYG